MVCYYLTMSNNHCLKCRILSKDFKNMKLLDKTLNEIKHKYGDVSVHYDCETGERVIFGCSESYITTFILEVQKHLHDVPLHINDIEVVYYETISKPCDEVVRAKSPNRHITYSVTIEQNDDGCTFNNENDGCFITGDMVNDITKGFEMSCTRGPLCKLPLKNIALRLKNVTQLVDYTLGRYAEQSRWAIKSALMGAVILSEPRLLEPIYICTLIIPCHETNGSEIQKIVGEHRGDLIEMNVNETGKQQVLTINLPVNELTMFKTKIGNLFGSQIYSVYTTFSHWSVLDSDPYESDSLANKIIMKINKNTG